MRKIETYKEREICKTKRKIETDKEKERFKIKDRNREKPKTEN